jgi:hypothetical protein
VARAYNAKHTHATFHQSEEYAYSLIHLATLLGTLRIKILSTRDIRYTEDDITAIANDGMEWNRNPDDEDDLLPNELILNLNTLEHEGVHSLVLTDSRHVMALRYTQGEWYLLDSELFRPTRATPKTWPRVARYTTHTEWQRLPLVYNWLPNHGYQ